MYAFKFGQLATAPVPLSVSSDFHSDQFESVHIAPSLVVGTLAAGVALAESSYESATIDF